MSNSIHPYRYETTFAFFIVLWISLFLPGCSKWNVAPKDIVPASTLPTVEVTTSDVFSISGRGWTASFTFNLTPSSQTKVKELGVCYSATNKTPSLVDATGATAQSKTKDLTLPASVSFIVTTKGTYYYRAYAVFDDGRVSYSKVDSFVTT
jgi:hypothetical protein